jgi:hypothetical protein
MKDFITMLKWLLVNENNYSEEEADNLIKNNSSIVSQGLIRGNFSLRATAIALIIKTKDKGELL